MKKILVEGIALPTITENWHPSGKLTPWDIRPCPPVLLIHKKVHDIILLKRIGWDSDLVVVLLNSPATFTESELKTTWKLTEPEKFHLNLDWEFTKLIIQSIFRSDSVNVAGPLSKTTTKSLSQPILYSFYKISLSFCKNFRFLRLPY